MKWIRGQFDLYIQDTTAYDCKCSLFNHLHTTQKQFLNKFTKITTVFLVTVQLAWIVRFTTLSPYILPDSYKNPNV
jgi:hypothetical protein